MWQSMKPGRIHLPAISIFCAPAGISTFAEGPTALIFCPWANYIDLAGLEQALINNWGMSALRPFPEPPTLFGPLLIDPEGQGLIDASGLSVIYIESEAFYVRGRA